MTDLDAILGRLTPDYGPTEPHPLAAGLVLPDGSPAPAELRQWAAFDNRIPWFLAGCRGPQTLAGPDGVVLVQPMADVLRQIVVDDVLDELDDDEDTETHEHVEELAAEFTCQYPGWGVVLEPEQYPDWVLWVPPSGPPVALTYKRERFSAGEPFVEFVAARYLDD